MPIVTPSEGLDLIVKDAKKIIATEALGLKADLVSAAPVGNPATWKTKYPPKNYVGGTFKAGWQMKKVSDLHFQIYNPVEYASILWRGYRNGRGSKQWPDGGDIMLKQTDNAINRRMASIKH